MKNNKIRKSDLLESVESSCLENVFVHDGFICIKTWVKATDRHDSYSCDAVIECDPYSDRGYGVIHIFGNRFETDEEYNNRLVETRKRKDDAEKARKDLETAERKELERLKKKYEKD